MMQSLGVSVNRHKIYPCYSGIHHPVNSCTAGATDADNFNTGERFDIRIDDLSRPEVHALLNEHLAHMHSITPAESVHALPIDELLSKRYEKFRKLGKFSEETSAPPPTDAPAAK